MDTYVAYCGDCNCEVEVVLGHTADGTPQLREARCLSRVSGCRDVVCPIEGARLEDLAEHLEFLPREAAGSRPRDLVEATRLLEKAREASVRRHLDPEP